MFGAHTWVRLAGHLGYKPYSSIQFSLLWCFLLFQFAVVFSLVSVCCGAFLLFQFTAVLSLVSDSCASPTASQPHSLAASQPHTSSLISVYMCMYRGSFHHSTTDVRRPLPPVVFSLVSVCCGAFLLFQGRPLGSQALQFSSTCWGPISQKHNNCKDNLPDTGWRDVLGAHFGKKLHPRGRRP